MVQAKQVMKLKGSTILIDRFTRIEFSTKEISTIVVEMAKTDTEEEIDRFLDRFLVRESR